MNYDNIIYPKYVFWCVSIVGLLKKPMMMGFRCRHSVAFIAAMVIFDTPWACFVFSTIFYAHFLFETFDGSVIMNFDFSVHMCFTLLTCLWSQVLKIGRRNEYVWWFWVLVKLFDGFGSWWNCLMDLGFCETVWRFWLKCLMVWWNCTS